MKILIHKLYADSCALSTYFHSFMAGMALLNYDKGRKNTCPRGKRNEVRRGETQKDRGTDPVSFGTTGYSPVAIFSLPFSSSPLSHLYRVKKAAAPEGTAARNAIFTVYGKAGTAFHIQPGRRDRLQPAHDFRPAAFVVIFRNEAGFQLR